jgi:hypothetical protein
VKAKKKPSKRAPKKAPTLNDLWERMSERQRKDAFLLLFGVAKFYADPATWFAVSLIEDPPSGDIMTDIRTIHDSQWWDWGFGNKKPGGRARIAVAWITSMLRKLAG